MGLRLALLISGFVSVWVIGCGVVQEDTRVPETVEAHVEAIKQTLLCNGGNVNVLKNAETTMRLFCNISNSTQRIMSVRAYSDMLLALCLEGMPVRAREWAVSQYGSCVYHCFQIMRRRDIDPEEAMNWFFVCLAKYKDLSFSVSGVEKLPGETMQKSIERRSMARLFRSNYEQHISIIRRFWIPRLSLYLPDEYHAEFIHRFEELTGVTRTGRE